MGRGADLVFYLFVLFCLFRFVGIAGDQRRLDDQLTTVVRELALLTARPAPCGPGVPPGGPAAGRLDGRGTPGGLSVEPPGGDPAPLG